MTSHWITVCLELQEKSILCNMDSHKMIHTVQYWSTLSQVVQYCQNSMGHFIGTADDIFGIGAMPLVHTKLALPYTNTDLSIGNFEIVRPIRVLHFSLPLLSVAALTVIHSALLLANKVFPFRNVHFKWVSCGKLLFWTWNLHQGHFPQPHLPSTPRLS